MKELPKDLQEKVQFALFCIAFEVAPLSAADLVRLARRAKDLAETHATIPTDQTLAMVTQARRDFDARATACDFDVAWPGLWPQLSRAGYDITLPT